MRIKWFYEGGTDPVLSASTTGPLVLEILNKNLRPLSLPGQNPNYQFNTGISSQDVLYTLQIAEVVPILPKAAEKAISKDLSTSLTVGN